ncbi:excitatory amino acid transporter 3-like [Pseudoliparis swirei]|uniref:excitatory amino acid transporter 3-like n=1 Tax=Pseudoliparis swirei TaxID=2059687 RepID=UPI0024BEEAC8|nr:excitatory amino acid transporter 3-like [Pseudoliparis swirei]
MVFLDTAVTAVVLGLVVGLIIKFTATLSKLDKFLIRFPGELVFRLLHVVTTPLLITGVMTGVARLKAGSSGRMAFRASAITTLLSVTLGKSYVVR